jgi:hypothetical protein
MSKVFTVSFTRLMLKAAGTSKMSAHSSMPYTSTSFSRWCAVMGTGVIADTHF